MQALNACIVPTAQWGACVDSPSEYKPSKRSDCLRGGVFVGGLSTQGALRTFYVNPGEVLENECT